MTADEYREVGRKPNGGIMLRVRILHLLAKAMGVRFNLSGWPYGSADSKAVGVFHPRCGSGVLTATETIQDIPVP